MILAVALVLVFWTLWFAGPYIRRWLMRRSMNYIQDRMYRSMGIDPGQARRQSKKGSGTTSANRSRRRTRAYSHRQGKIIPAEYGETVSFTELAITGDEKWLTDTDKSPVYTEYRHDPQITDASYVIIN